MQQKVGLVMIVVPFLLGVLMLGAYIFLSAKNVVTPSNEVRAPSEPIIYVNIVSHNEDTLHPKYPDYSQDEATFTRESKQVLAFADMLEAHGAKYNFQTDWNFLLGMQKYDNGKSNLLTDLIKLGMEVDPHSHEHLGFNYADVAYLISTLGVTPSNNAGGFLASPAEVSKLDFLSAPITGERYDYTWSPVVAWGSGTNNHIDEESLWQSGVWRPVDAEHFDEHDPNGPLAVIGHYSSNWEGLDALLEKQANGELEDGHMYTVSIMNNQWELDEAYIAEFEARLKTYNDETNDGRIVWATLTQTYEDWVNVYNEVPTILPWSGETTPCGDGTCSPLERRMNTCTLDCS